MFFDGYACDKPESVTVRFHHQNGVPGKPELITEQLGTIAYGSPIIYERLKQGDPAFDKYKGSFSVSGTLYSAAMRAAIAEARNYIRACSGPEALKIDPEICAGIGGRIQIATITRSKGFRWVPGFGITSSPIA